MPGQIQDGTGSSRLAKVDIDNKLSTAATTTSEALAANREGRAFNLNTGIVTLVDAVETPLIYLKNNENGNLVIEAVAIGVFNSANGLDTSNVCATFIRNPTAGTIIEDAEAVPINSNRNYGSNINLVADVFLGETGRTMTNGADHILVRLSENQRAFVTINEILPKGTSFGVKFKPPTSNDSIGIYVAVICYVEKKV